MLVELILALIPRLASEVELNLVRFASAGPQLEVSPSMQQTRLANKDLQELSPLTASLKEGLTDPTKQGVTAYEKMMSANESTLKKSLAMLDNQVLQCQEAREKARVMKEELEKRMAKKRKAMATATDKGRKAATSQLNKKGSSDSGEASDKDDDNEGEGDDNGDDMMHDDTAGDCDIWMLGSNVEELHDLMPHNVEVRRLTETSSFVIPVIFQFPDAAPTALGWTQERSDEMFQKHMDCNDADINDTDEKPPFDEKQDYVHQDRLGDNLAFLSEFNTTIPDLMRPLFEGVCFFSLMNCSASSHSH